MRMDIVSVLDRGCVGGWVVLILEAEFSSATYRYGIPTPKASGFGACVAIPTVIYQDPDTYFCACSTSSRDLVPRGPPGREVLGV
jgi:hypothetical protein